MKNGWQTKTLGELGSAARESAQIIPDAEYELWSVPSFADDSPEVAIGKAIGSSKLRVRPNDVLICKINPRINRVWLVRDPIEGRDQIGSTEWLVFRIKTDAGLLPSWLIHFVSAPEFREWIVSEVSGATGSHTRAKSDGILRQRIPVPPLAEQRRIVGILDEAFEGLATAKANAEQNLQNARALFKSHLQAVFTQRGHGWMEKRIPDVCLTFGRGKSRHRPRNEPSLYGGDYPFIQTGDLSNADHVVTTYSQTYNDKGLAQSKLWPKGTVGIAIVGATIGESGVLGFDACFPDSVIGMTVKPTIADPFFLEYMLQHFKGRVKSQGAGSARENINIGTFDALLFPMPPISEQQRIVEKVDRLKNETQRLESLYQRKLAALDELKKSLLHRAFSGQL